MGISQETPSVKHEAKGLSSQASQELVSKTN